MKKTYKYEPDYVIPPGATIKELIKSNKMTDKQFSVVSGIPKKILKGLLDGSQAITVKIAHRLEVATGYPKSFWMNLEEQYRNRVGEPDF